MFGGLQKDSGVAINTANVFSALEKKKKNKKKVSKKESTKKASEFWTKAPVAVKSWADCEDDDDDYYATVPPICGHDHKTEKEESDKEESDDQEDYDIDNDADEETEENEDHDTKASLDMKSVITSVPHLNKTKEPEKQLSKKEIKKKELAELDKVLEEFGFLPKDNRSDHSQNKKVEEDSKEDLDSKPSSAIITENKTKRKRKTKKDISKEEKGGSIANGNIQEQVLESKPEANADFANPKAVLKKLASQQKKKSGKESDVAAKAAASEAAARAAKLAAAKKKEKIHYNQHPSK